MAQGTTTTIRPPIGKSKWPAMNKATAMYLGKFSTYPWRTIDTARKNGQEPIVYPIDDDVFRWALIINRP